VQSRVRQVALALILGYAVLVPPVAAQPAALDAQAVYQRAAAAIGMVLVTRDGTSGGGTGFVIDPTGMVVTAAHVVRGAERIALDFGDGSVHDARLVGYDARRDVAVLRIQPRGRLPALDVIESTTVSPGEPVVVIGTPRGRPRVMTTGVVRATGVTLPGQLPGIFILFDAEVQPGNSGGPLLNRYGQVIGVVVAIARQRDGSAGVATSSSALRTSLPAMASGARLERAWLGISGTTFEAQEPWQAPGRGRGVLVTSVIPGGPAARAGLRGHDVNPPGDIIVAIDGEPIDNWDDLLLALGAREPGQRVRVSLLRAGAQIDISITLETRP
jgi:serine protease Do